MILHVPHASTAIPATVRRTVLLSDAELAAEVVVMTDAHTDHLFEAEDDRVTRVIYPASRLVVDPERFADDAREPMSRIGMGAIYTRCSDGRVLRAGLTESERQRLIDQYYVPHHQSLADSVAAELKSFGVALIIDCHSFPSRPLPYELDQNPNRPDICIGTDSYHTPEWLATAVASSFGECGYSVAINRPFSGSIVPSEYYRQDGRVLSVMIEVNRQLYLNEETAEMTADFSRVRSQIATTLGKITLTCARVACVAPQARSDTGALGR